MFSSDPNCQRRYDRSQNAVTVFRHLLLLLRDPCGLPPPSPFTVRDLRRSCEAERVGIRRSAFSKHRKTKQTQLRPEISPEMRTDLSDEQQQRRRRRMEEEEEEEEGGGGGGGGGGWRQKRCSQSVNLEDTLERTAGPGLITNLSLDPSRPRLLQELQQSTCARSGVGNKALASSKHSHTAPTGGHTWYSPSTWGSLSNGINKHDAAGLLHESDSASLNNERSRPGLVRCETDVRGEQRTIWVKLTGGETSESVCSGPERHVTSLSAT
ncbi:unnamed protein product [Pleuronectes platessa]|uniref:Uncharacterized protein n=1 Tax=Pleuronectes platessa TaxID=8262 RepID=A0A9N7UEM3_PLEPL|nr:unnamed protein product [Pleuronectes platessa]